MAETPTVIPPAPAPDPSLVASIIDLAADAILTVGPDDRIMSWNRGATQMFGWTEAEVVGRSFAMLIPDEEAARGELAWLNRQVVESGPIRDFETRRRAKDAHIIDVSLTRTAVFDEAGRLVGYSAILRDISERKRLERRMLRAERLAAAGELAAGVAHEIGAPLTAMVMSVEQMLRQRCADCAGGEQMRVVQSQVERIARLARQLVELAQPAAVARAPARIADVVHSAVSLLHPYYSQKGARIEVAVAPDLPLLEADAGQLQQVLLNILLNAHRAVPEGSGLATIVAGHGSRGLLEIVISDNGPGISPEDLPHLFTAFFSRSGSTGLGLAVAAQIVQAHGGVIEAASPPGGGAVFTVSLPVAGGGPGAKGAARGR